MNGLFDEDFCFRPGNEYPRIDREVQRRRRAGLPIYVAEDGKVVDLQGEPYTEPDN